LKSWVKEKDNQWRFWYCKKIVLRLGVGSLRLVFVQEKNIILGSAKIIYGIYKLSRIRACTPLEVVVVFIEDFTFTALYCVRAAHGL
jgi:hypothetical protein